MRSLFVMGIEKVRFICEMRICVIFGSGGGGDGRKSMDTINGIKWRG